MNSYRSLLEDIEWLRSEWREGQPDSLTDGHLRRGSATLRLLLVDGLIQRAWRHYGFEKQPRLPGPDLAALAAQSGFRLDLAHVVAGGGRQNGLDLCFIGAFRVDNPTTGTPADAECGFAVAVTTIARDATRPSTSGPLDPLVERLWFISEYLESPGGVRRGKVITRREIIEYFRNYVGGVHHDFLTRAKHANEERYRLVAELQGHIRADVRDGLHFELLSIGQAVVRSADILALRDRIGSDM